MGWGYSEMGGWEQIDFFFQHNSFWLFDRGPQEQETVGSDWLLVLGLACITPYVAQRKQA